MGAGGAAHANLLAAYGKLATGRFDETDSADVVLEGTRILTQAIVDMNAALIRAEKVELVSIDVTRMPDKTEYFVGDTLDLTGMIVTAIYSNGSIKEITGYTTSPGQGGKLNYAQEVTVTVKYVEDGMTALYHQLKVNVSSKQEITLVSATPSAYVTKLNGNKNDLTITVTEKYSDGTSNAITETFSINNNAVDTYTVGGYKVYVDTKGNDQIRDCRIIEMAEAA
jgi:hypothetical protein